MSPSSLVFLISFLLSSTYLHAQYADQIIVAKDGSGDYSSIQTAIDHAKSFPDQSISILIKNGQYNEKVIIYPWNANLTITGENRDSTGIIYDDHFKKINKGRNSTFHTFTMSVEASQVKVKNLTVINASGDIGQAIALSVSGDRCVFKNCSVIGNQDALYCTGENSRQYFKDCYIEGTTDFIFGNATVLFDKCVLHTKSNSFITAASTTKLQDHGLVFKNCRLTASEHVSKVYLGRPWRKFAKTAFINCEYGHHIIPEGWKVWSNKDDFNTTFYAEYTTEDTSNRVSWSHQLKKRDLKRYRMSKIFRGWQPSIF